MTVNSNMEKVLVLYHSASGCVTDALCSLEDPEVSTSYIKNRLYTAVYDMTECVLLANGAPVPNTLLERTVKIRLPSIDGNVPSVCDELIDRASMVGRVDLANIARSIECWISQVKYKYPEIFGRYHIGTECHSLMC